MIPLPAQPTVDVNRAEFSGALVAADLSPGRPDLTTWSDPGERAALTSIASRVRGGRILDLGMGAGRTTAFLRLLSDDYVGVDYTPGLVDACRDRFPGVDVRVGDARALDVFPDSDVDFVTFSYNGIDSVGHADRARVFAEIARVLRPGGLLHFSTLNLDGPCHRATPWRPAGSQLQYTWSPLYRVAMRALRWLRAPLALPRAARRRRALLSQSSSGPGWAVAPMEAYDFGLLVHYTTLDAARAELEQHGLRLLAAFDAEYGRPIDAVTDLRTVRYFQLVAERA